MKKTLKSNGVTKEISLTENKSNEEINVENLSVDGEENKKDDSVVEFFDSEIENNGNAETNVPKIKLTLSERVNARFKKIGGKFQSFGNCIQNTFGRLNTQAKEEGGGAVAKTIGLATWKGTKRLSKRWFIDAFTGMAQGLFVTLIAGTIVKQFGTWIGNNAFGNFLVTAGSVASFLMGAGIGAGIASHLKAPKLVIFACMVAGMIGAFSTQFLEGSWLIQGAIDGNVIEKSIAVSIKSPGNPISAYICALLACEIGKFVSGKTKIDILVVPLTVVLVAIASTYICIPFVKLIDLISSGINVATTAQPFLMGMVIAVSVGILLTMPTSSAAICIALGLGGIAGGAAVVGCACQMVGFAVQSYRENKFSGLISQGLGTSMLQIPNIMKKPIIFLPPIIASAIAGPLSTCVFMLQCGPAGSGMGTCGFVGIITTIDASLKAGLPSWKLGLGIALLFFVIPIVVCVGMSELLRKFKIIKYGDMSLNYDN